MIIQIQPWIDRSEMEELAKVIESTFVTEGAYTQLFESLTKEMTGAKYAIAMTNGTAALYCCIKALNIGPGDEVIVPNLTFIATANAVIMAGATPIFCDVRPDTFCIDVESATKLLTKKTKAIMPVHLYGQAADMEQLMTFAKNHSLYVIEDAAQGVGVRFNNQHVGTFGNLGVLSYYGNKTITCGEGGIVLTDDAALAAACYRLKNHGRDKKGVFIHDHIGFNFAFTEMQAAVGVSQMKKLPKIIVRKAEIESRYRAAFKSIPGINALYIDPRTSPVFWFTSFLVDDAEIFSREMERRDVQTRRFFYPLHMQPCYATMLSGSRRTFPISEQIYKGGISMPSSYLLTEQEQEQVIDAVLDVLK